MPREQYDLLHAPTERNRLFDHSVNNQKSLLDKYCLDFIATTIVVASLAFLDNKFCTFTNRENRDKIALVSSPSL